MIKQCIILIFIISTNLYSEKTYFYVNAKSVRLRESPSLDSKILTILKENETVDFVGEKSESESTTRIGKIEKKDYFYLVKTSSDLVGWVFGYYITDSKTFEKDITFCSRSIPTETVIGLEKKANFNRKELTYNEEFKIKDTNFSIRNGGCDYFTHIIKIETNSNLKFSDQKKIINLLTEKLINLSKFYQNDFDLKIVIKHLQKRKIQFDTNYKFLSGKQIANAEEENPGPTFHVKKPNLSHQKINIEIILASGLL
ncbi:SH3 domain-containing protein [Leptospira kanakyensis]|uniref:SH3 domain-containing protein n=1 Tax=Leptospira kanakyensis TaxID=2484968 RepID=UPI00223DDF4C|nr:SH3 domain-containing protein [Leptospira kanakyensis]MCW7483099.1 SH3 domain-containing protein [Leptospira kanakyensis]